MSSRDQKVQKHRVIRKGGGGAENPHGKGEAG